MPSFTPYLSELKLVSFNFAPKGWALCNGQLLPINQNQPLFALLGTTYGGNGQTTFALPNLQGRVPVHVGDGFTLGAAGGEQSHTVSMNEMPAHTHIMGASALDAGTKVPTGAVLANAANVYAAATGLTALVSGTVSNVGGNQPHTNLQPYLVLNWCIALQGIFPSQT